MSADRVCTAYEDDKHIVMVSSDGRWQYWVKGVAMTLWFLTPLWAIPDAIRQQVEQRLRETA